jgi:hypothetical protein
VCQAKLARSNGKKKEGQKTKEGTVKKSEVGQEAGAKGKKSRKSLISQRLLTDENGICKQ